MVGILQNTIIFANNDEDEDNMDRECQDKSESAASNGPRRREKTCLWGFRQSEFQTSLLRYSD